MSSVVLMTRKTNSEETEQKLRRITLEIKHEDGEDVAIVGIGNDNKIVTFERLLSDKEEAKRIFNIFVETFGEPLLEAMFSSSKKSYGNREWEWWI